MNYFTADSHFSYHDETIIPRDYRPFKTLTEMNNEIIKIWNSQANKDDIIYHLGDFINYNWQDMKDYEKCLKFVQKINAKIILILGNNELRLMENEFNNDFDRFREYLLSLGFYDVIKEKMYIDIGNERYCLNHFPVNHDPKCNNLFGHIHKTVFVKKYGFNVGVDNHYFRLFDEAEILNLSQRRSFFDKNVYD